MSQQNNIEILSELFAAGEIKTFALSGEYFEVIDCTKPIDVVLSAISGAQLARMKQAQASSYSKSVSFGVIQIASGTAQTVRFAYGSGETGTRRSSGSVSISGPVDLGASTLNALESINLNTETLDELKTPLQKTGSYSSISALVANTPVQVVAPNENTAGIIVLSGHMTSIVLGGAVAGLIAKNALPANVVDGDPIMWSDMVSYVVGSGPAYGGSIKIPQYVDPGLGLFFVSGTTEVSGSRSIRFRTL